MTEIIEKKPEKIEKKPEALSLIQAELDFARFCAAWRIDLDEETMSEQLHEDFENSKRKIINAFRRGDALLNEKDQIVYTLYKPFPNLTEVICRRPTGAHFEKMDGIGRYKEVRKMNNFFAAALGIVPGFLSKMDGIDVLFIQKVYLLFMNFA